MPVNKSLAVGQWLRHRQFGPGVTVRSDAQRTTIDFDEHGRKVFVTDMLEVELTGAPEAPVRRRKKTPAPS
jgi:hypothetical protein